MEYVSSLVIGSASWMLDKCSSEMYVRRFCRAKFGSVRNSSWYCCSGGCICSSLVGVISGEWLSTRSREIEAAN